MKSNNTKLHTGPKKMSRSSNRNMLYGIAAASIAIHAAIWVLLIWKIPFDQSTIFLHYNIYFGIDLTGSWAQLLWMPVSGLVILIMNSFVVFFSKTFDKMIVLTVSIFTLLTQCILLLASLFVVLLNA